MRSHDVLHDFFVPQFRARMNIVPGQVSSFWFTPTQAGRYEAMCAQLCGVGHPNMRGFVVVEDAAAFQAWLQAQPTFAATLAPAAPRAAAAGGDAGRRRPRARPDQGLRRLPHDRRQRRRRPDLEGPVRQDRDA